MAQFQSEIARVMNLSPMPFVHKALSARIDSETVSFTARVQTVFRWLLRALLIRPSHTFSFHPFANCTLTKRGPKQFGRALNEFDAVHSLRFGIHIRDHRFEKAIARFIGSYNDSVLCAHKMRYSVRFSHCFHFSLFLFDFRRNRSQNGRFVDAQFMKQQTIALGIRARPKRRRSV